MIVFCQFLITAVENRILIAGVFKDSGFKIVADENPCAPTEKRVYVDMGCNPVFLLHRQECFRITIHAERQGRDKQITASTGVSVRIVYMQFCPCSVNHEPVSGLMLDMQRQPVLIHIV